MDIDLAQKAISSALSGFWKEAREINKKILRETPKDIDALNRLARAYAELGEITKARSTAEKVLKIDPFNTIAEKSLRKWKGFKKGETQKGSILPAQLFLEEAGRTKIVSLLNIADEKVLAKLDAGDEVSINPRSHRISVLTGEGKYIGRLPDDLSARLRKLINYGYQYKIVVKSIEEHDVSIFIKEVGRPKEFEDLNSFPAEKIEYVSFTPPELVHKREELPSPPEEVEETF
ncbi:hypothetical protein A2V56_03290 [Candidatus Woesebacteria bacterium RBG_19FT_COMBO_42_9]|uniref:Uncharacterized protein n=1 Tax=Candidatus Woesebacteria bacterium RBG_16_42_24 TaxID=1802485 RepID=A0A1F7XK02_9BACT|nr:MAG: hypothetical protein A2V97_01815 [Candidatus Woesebacteria bacterium RBG_16_42_24]OGM16399.1 MAG: hypothetical protein A2V56_03290 [Candidatus Woesebacteria bacterium RBG_19FT_COMBO_42_9]OGM67330.1 MAG: hypothetical protein A2985_04210 [Candidatus Woesebacteria bacterium RIFCSPLOWO2_01_FULL_43_11]